MKGLTRRISLPVFALCAMAAAARAQHTSGEDSLAIARLFEVAGALQDSGRFDDAIKTYTHILSLDSSSGLAYLRRGLACAHQEKLDLALDDFRRVIQMYPGSPAGYGSLGWTLILQQKFTEALPFCQKAYDLDSSEMAFAANLGHAHLFTGATPAARSCYRKMLTLVSSESELTQGPVADLELFIARGWKSALCAQQLEWMKHEFATVYRFQKDADVLWKRGQDLQKEGKLREAAAAFAASARAEQQSAEPRAADLHEELIQTVRVEVAVGEYDSAMTYGESALNVGRRANDGKHIAEALGRIGEIEQKRGQYERALRYYDEALALDRRLGNKAGEAVRLDSKAYVHHDRGEYDSARVFYTLALDINRQLGDEANISANLSGLALVFLARGQYDSAASYNLEALSIDRKLGSEPGIASDLSNLGVVSHKRGQYDIAVRYIEEALSIDRKLGRKPLEANRLSNLGAVYDSWGQYERAISLYQEALAIERQLGLNADISKELSNIGVSWYFLKNYDQAVSYYEQAAALDRTSGDVAGLAGELNNLGSVYTARGEYEKANSYYNEALAYFRKSGQEDRVAVALGNIAGVYVEWGKYDDALANYREALAIGRKLGDEPGVATRLANMSTVAYGLKRYPEAIRDLTASIQLREKLRRTATGDVRRDYLASQIGTYRYLVSAHVRNNDPAAAFAAMEQSRARLLAERLAGSDSLVAELSLAGVQKSLDLNTAVVIYANTDWEKKVFMVITREDVHCAEYPDTSLMAAARATYGDDMRASVRSRSTGDNQLDFGALVNYYRSLLTTAAFSRGVSVADDSSRQSRDRPQTFRDVSRLLGDYLIRPVSRYLNGKSSLIIIPEGILGFVPFETLMDDDGHYLAESHDVRYTQSLGVLQMLEARIYSGDRLPLLAFGGAVYDPVTYATDMIRSERELEGLQKNISATLASRGSARVSYASLGVGTWKNLPGTLTEVQAIARITQGTRVVTGDSVTEGSVKGLSARGTLARYKVLHFATHGIVVPEVPDLSALVLSQFTMEREGEDGYMRMGEIAALKLKADFVNLSACETGLGKLYGGEGVVGLTQAFLLAGANGLSVSLWQVADESTSKFMVGLYGLVATNGVSYARAIADMKRKFIAGDFGEQYRAPYYWAPFVYYGK